MPATVTFQTKPEIALEQIRAALSTGIPKGVVLMDAGYGADTGLRTEITALGLTYVAGIQPHTSVWAPETGPLPPKSWSGRGRPTSRMRRDAEHQPVQAKALAIGLPAEAWQTLTWREGSADWLVSRYARIRVRAAHRDYDLPEPRPEEWLLIEWPEGEAELVVNGVVGGENAEGAVASFQIRGGMTRGTEFLFEIHGDVGDLTLTATTRASMQRQELTVRGAQGAAKELTELPVPAKYRWVPEGLPGDSRYNVAQLYTRLAESIRDGKPASPSFAAAVTRHRLLDAITLASETGQKQVPRMS